MQTSVLDSLIECIEAALEDIRSGKTNLYQSARKFIDSLRQAGKSPNTVSQFRSYLPDFFISVLGEENWKQKR